LPQGLQPRRLLRLEAGAVVVVVVDAAVGAMAA
jgi:hypothetical protein